jgi:hypothetical protein
VRVDQAGQDPAVDLLHPVGDALRTLERDPAAEHPRLVGGLVRADEDRAAQVENGVVRHDRQPSGPG